MAKERVKPRAWISLEEAEGLALLGAALRERRWETTGPVFELGSAVGQLGGADRSRAITLRPKDFAFTGIELVEHPAIWAFCAKDLPLLADHIDQETPISCRPLDDAIKSLVPVFVLRAKQLIPSCHLDLGTKPVRWPSFYQRLPYLLPAEGPPSRPGNPEYRDGTRDAAILAFAYRSMKGKEGRRITRTAAAKWAVGRVAWIGLQIGEDKPQERDTRVFIKNKNAPDRGRSEAVARVARRMTDMCAELGREPYERGFAVLPEPETEDELHGRQRLAETLGISLAETLGLNLGRPVEDSAFPKGPAPTPSAEDLKWRAIAAAAVDQRIAARKNAVRALRPDGSS